MKLHQATPAVLADLPHLVSRLGLSGCPNSPNATSQCLPLPSPALCYWHPMKMSETSRPALIYSWCLCRCVSSVRQNFRPCVHVIKGKHFYNGLNVTIVTQKKRTKISRTIYIYIHCVYMHSSWWGNCDERSWNWAFCDSVPLDFAIRCYFRLDRFVQSNIQYL